MPKMKHLAEEQLVGFLDGEALPKEAAAIEAHLANCGECSATLLSLREAASAYAEFHNAPGEASLSQIGIWKPLSFGERETNTAPSPAARRRWAWLLATATCAVVASALFWLQTGDSRQMGNLLGRASAVHLAATSRLRVNVRGRVLFRPAVLVGAGGIGSGGDHLATLFREARYDWTDPLSARSYQTWRSQLPNKRDRVTEIRNGRGERESYRLRTRTASGNLQEVSLTLAAETLEPRDGEFTFQSFGTVSISEAGPEEIQPARPEGGTLGHHPSETLRETPATAEDELRVFAALHALGADVSEPLDVSLDSAKSHVLVSGLGVSAGNRQAIRQALGGLPKTLVDFNRASSDPVEKTERPGAGVNGADRSSSFSHVLEDRAGGSRQFQALVDSEIETSSAALVRAHALWLLAKRFPPDVESALSPADRATLRRIQADHGTELERYAERSVITLQPLVSLNPRKEVRAESWQSIATELFAETRALDQVLNRLLAGNLPEAEGPQTLEELRLRLTNFDSLARAEAGVAQ